MSSISIGGYTLEDKGNGKLTITEDSTGETVEVDGSTVDFAKLAADLDAGNQSITNLQSLSTGEQNNNEVNLTKLVNDGQYADILDAIANHPPKTSRGVQHIVEPGTYQVDTQRQITYSNTEIAVKGYGETGNEDGPTKPAVIEWAGSDSTAMLLIGGSGVGTVAGLSFRGFEMRPATDGAGTVAVRYNAPDSSNPVLDINWYNCRWSQWGGKALDTNSRNYNFDIKYWNCSWFKNRGEIDFGDQIDMFGGKIAAINDGGYGAHFSRESTVVGTFITDVDPNDNTTPARIASDMVFFAPENVEFTGPAGISVMSGDNQLASWIMTGITGSPTNGIEFESGGGAKAYVFATYNNLSGEKLVFNGGPNEHNGTFALGYYGDSDVSYNDINQDLFILSTREFSTAPTTVGLFGVANDPAGDGTINPSLVHRRKGQTSTEYWERDGTM